MRYIGFFEKYTYIRAENPVEKIWNILMMHSDVNYLKKYWSDRSDEDYLYTTTSIKQAYEYYLASKTLSLNTKPLLLYYSCLNLTKAALFIANDATPNGNYHGLYESKENKTKRILSPNDFLDFKVLSNDGIFSDLAKTLGNEIPHKTEFSMRQFLIDAIELRNAYTGYFNHNSPIIIPSIEISHHGDIEIIFFNFDQLKAEIADEIKTRFLAFDQKLESNYLYLRTTIKRTNNYDDDLKEVLDPLFDFSVLSNNTYYYNTNPQKIPNSASLFGISFLLGCLVRYHPEKLYNLFSEKDTSMQWVLGEICEVITRVYPNLMLNVMAKGKIKFGQGIDL